MLLRPDSHSDESEVGYQMRLAHLNGLCDPRWLGGAKTGQHEKLRMCPACLKAEGARWLNAWRIEQPVCRQHEVWLVDVCQGCGLTLIASRSRFLECRCGHQLVANRTRTLSLAAREVIIRQEVGEGILRWLGAIAKYGLLGKPGKRAESKSMIEQIDLQERGAEIIFGWPASFEALLGVLRTDHVARQVSLASDAFPFLAKQIRRIRDVDWRGRVADATHAYVQASQKTEQILLSRYVRSVRSAGIVAKRLGVSVNRATAMLMTSDAALRVTAGGRHRFMVTEDVEHAIREKLKAVLSITAAAEMMQLSQPRLRELVLANVVSAQGYGVSRESLLCVLSRLGKACVEDGEIGSDLRPLPHVLRTIVPRTLTAAFFDALFSSQISLVRNCAASTRRGCEQFLISTSFVRAWAVRRKPSLESADALDITRAASVLQVKPEVVAHLATVGLLRSVGARIGPRGRLMLSAQGIHDFYQRYTPLKLVAAASGITPKCAPGWARSQGIELVCGPTIDGCRQYIARRPGSFPSTSTQYGDH